MPHEERDMEECYVMTETGVMPLQAKECQGIMTTSEAREKPQRILPYRFQREQVPADTLTFYF